MKHDHFIVRVIDQKHLCIYWGEGPDEKTARRNCKEAGGDFRKKVHVYQYQADEPWAELEAGDNHEQAGDKPYVYCNDQGDIYWGNCKEVRNDRKAEEEHERILKPILDRVNRALADS